MSRGGAVILVAVVGCLAASAVLPTVALGSGQITETITGAAVDPPAEAEKNQLKSIRDAVPPGVLPESPNVLLVFAEGRQWYVVTSEPVKSGKATVKGRTVAKTTTQGIFIAQEVSVSTDGEQISIDELQSNPGNYQNQLVEVTAPYRQVSYAVDPADRGFLELQAHGAFPGDVSGALALPPGKAGRWSVINTSAVDSKSARRQISAKKIQAGNGEILTTGWNKNRWWMDSTVTLTGIVSHDSATGQSSLFLVETKIQSTPVSGVSEVRNRGGELQGEVVSFQTRAVGTRVSSQEFLTTVASCGQNSVANPVTGCMPAPTDSMIHSGVLFNGIPESRSQTIVYAGVSNHVQQKVATQETGTYQVTGRVVSTSKIDSRLPDGYAVVVYDMERTGDLNIGDSAQQQASVWAGSVTDKLKAQLQTAESVTKPTTTATPTTSTSTPTRTETAAQTAIQTPDSREQRDRDEPDSGGGAWFGNGGFVEAVLGGGLALTGIVGYLSAGVLGLVAVGRRVFQDTPLGVSRHALDVLAIGGALVTGAGVSILGGVAEGLLISGGLSAGFVLVASGRWAIGGLANRSISSSISQDSVLIYILGGILSGLLIGVLMLFAF